MWWWYWNKGVHESPCLSWSLVYYVIETMNRWENRLYTRKNWHHKWALRHQMIFAHPLQLLRKYQASKNPFLDWQLSSNKLKVSKTVNFQAIFSLCSFERSRSICLLIDTYESCAGKAIWLQGHKGWKSSEQQVCERMHLSTEGHCELRKVDWLNASSVGAI